MRFISLLLTLACATMAHAVKPVIYQATDSSAVRYVGRTLPDLPTGDVTFNWSGTYIETILDGRDLQLHLSDTGRSYFDIVIDGQPAGKIASIAADTIVTVASGLKPGTHRVELHKRTEGETGTSTFHEFILPRGGSLTATTPRPRFIEVIGDSLSAGFGTEGKDRDEPFTAENENTNLSYSTIVPRYFDADYAVIAHSGRGVVRNYGDPLRESLSGTMLMRYDNVLDAEEAPAWNFTSYKPDLVIINLGANDFMTEPNPYRHEFVAGYKKLLGKVFEKYGPETAVLCVIPYAVGSHLDSYWEEAIQGTAGTNTRILRQPVDQINSTTDRGAVWHPNYSGQLKMSLLAIPTISTMMSWPLPSKPVE